MESASTCKIRVATEADFPEIWPFFHQIVSQAETYAYEPDTTYEAGLELWLRQPRATYVCILDHKILGSYYIKTNQQGPGKHVCNCAYMVSADARGKGVASAMCEHSQQLARSLGYRAMQFNFVAASNHAAIKLWLKLGFSIVGTLPEAFAHPRIGFVDAHVLYKTL